CVVFMAGVDVSFVTHILPVMAAHLYPTSAVNHTRTVSFARGSYVKHGVDQTFNLCAAVVTALVLSMCVVTFRSRSICLSAQPFLSVHEIPCHKPHAVFFASFSYYVPCLAK
ncbi:MAG: hypothetical protein ABIR84_03710, partial [Candidatus Nitrotoga sp.]